MNALSDPVFKGCTRPAMVWGVPLVPFVAVGGGILVPSIWVLLVSPVAGVSVVLLIVPVFLTMRVVTRHDDQRLAQHALRLRMTLRQRNSHYWRAHAYVPLAVKRRG
ncbi:type IV secretion system protein VirB3 [Paraburkholderia phosphatilytica]|uniref:type IV secretion system protein VirB3 n=1 Tax=Paraburkholderia phosphatilytica TaxID=2282883 RepID=UPI0013DF494B|nr:VirB3 family type IV secretion system protein [Paraburkholderia phosphatilytica]